MTRIIALALAIAAGSVAHASDDGKLTDMAKADQIRATLAEQRCEVRKAEVEDGQRNKIYLYGDLDLVKSKVDD